MQEQDRRWRIRSKLCQPNCRVGLKPVDHGTCDLISRRVAYPCTAAPLCTEPLALACLACLAWLHRSNRSGGTPLQVNNLLYVCSNTTTETLMRYHITKQFHTITC